MEMLLRQLDMLRLIPRHPRRIDAVRLLDELAALGYTTTLRTIQRDLNKLSAALPLRSDESKPQGWWWPSDAALLEIPGIDPQSALVFKMAENYLREVLPSSTLESLRPWFKAANGVLESQADKAGSWMNKVRIIPRGQPLLPPVIDAEIQATVYQAVFENRKLAISYMKRGASAPKDYEFNAMAIVQRGHLIYVIGSVRDYDNPVLHLMHRIRSAALLDVRSKHIPGFDLDNFIADGDFGYRVGPPIKLVADFDNIAAEIFYETPMSADQTLDEQTNGKTRLTATINDTKELRAWLRGFGSQLNLIEPRRLLDL